MSKRRCYVLDSDVLIQAHRQYFGFDICPGFWDALLVHHQNGRVCSIDKVKAELAKGNDALKNWSESEAPESFFVESGTSDGIERFGLMVNWVQGEAQYLPAAKAEFAGVGVADGWVIAHAKSNDFVVVTQEVHAPDAKKRVPIPNVCHAFGVECMNAFEMLRDLQVELVLRKSK